MKNSFTNFFKATSLLISVFLASSQLATAGVIRHDINIDNYVSLLNSNSTYESVGKLLINGTSDWASAVNIGNGYVLTAAHAVSGDIDSLSLMIGGSTYNVVDIDNDVLIHSWTGATSAGNDIALVRFQNGLDDATTAKLWNGDSLEGEVVTNVGFGKTGNGQTGVNQSSSVIKLAGQNVINYYGPSSLGWSDNIMFQSFDGPDSNALDLEYLTTSGDSGGGVFFEQNGETYLAGIHSFVNSSGGVTGIYGTSSGATSIDAYRDWIYSTTGISRPVPEPASFALLGLGLAGIFFVKRRRV